MKTTSKQKRTLDSIAGQCAEMWANGTPARGIVNLIAKEVGENGRDMSLREKAGGFYGVEMFHPFNLANMDVNLLRHLCKAIHHFGRGRLAAYKTVLESRETFTREVRTAVWIDYLGLVRGASQRRDWLWPYLGLYVAMRGEGYEIVRNISPEIFGLVNRKDDFRKNLKELKVAEMSFPEFEMHRMIQGGRLTKGFMRDVLNANVSFDVVANFMRYKEVQSVFPPVEMLFYLCSSCRPWRVPRVESETWTSAPLVCKYVGELAKICPECVKAVDVFGLTPLDYINFRHREGKLVAEKMGWRTDDGSPRLGGPMEVSTEEVYEWDQLAGLLAKLGADPTHPNKYGISYLDVRRQLHGRQKESLDWDSRQESVPSHAIRQFREAAAKEKLS